MNKMDIVIGHVKACKSFSEASKKIGDPVNGFGFKLTKNEQCLLLHYAVLYFDTNEKK